ncbi:hypothetical protein NDU88_006509 [Pleurodeles waltl]|uniref:Uncharacterized protein n=1 Tax=Pleurodeles waltl TaxID=8319 RepID=A0AAV7LV39_PLEWA|nr:hypothetical protein NDU88_006509 [Pleurodeles waltl]
MDEANHTGLLIAVYSDYFVSIRNTKQNIAKSGERLEPNEKCARPTSLIIDRARACSPTPKFSARGAYPADSAPPRVGVSFLSHQKSLSAYGRGHLQSHFGIGQDVTAPSISPSRGWENGIIKAILPNSKMAPARRHGPAHMRSSGCASKPPVARSQRRNNARPRLGRAKAELPDRAPRLPLPGWPPADPGRHGPSVEQSGAGVSLIVLCLPADRAPQPLVVLLEAAMFGPELQLHQ